MGAGTSLLRRCPPFTLTQATAHLGQDGLPPEFEIGGVIRKAGITLITGIVVAISVAATFFFSIG